MSADPKSTPGLEQGREVPTHRAQPKYLQIVDSLRASIEAGRYRNGERLPSEAELVRRFSVSRMTA